MEIVVVSDTSPVRALNHLGLLRLFNDLYGLIIIPLAVSEELRHPTTTCPAINVEDVHGFEIRRATGGSTADLPGDLDPGETEAIMLAIELHADLLLMDERKGTQAARRLGLATIGVFGVLLEAKRRGLVDRVTPLVDRLMTELKFYVSISLRQRIALLANE